MNMSVKFKAIFLIPASVFMASSLRRNPFIGSATIELQAVDAFPK